MPCALVENADYPDYLKSILKEIAAGNDEQLKACACSLKTPTTDEGCPILDEDNKIGAFPFCWTFTEDTSLVGAGTFNPIKLTLKDAMWLYWQSKNADQQISWSECDGGINIKIKSVSIEKTIQQKKELVCRKNISLKGIISSDGACNDPQVYSYPFILGEFFAQFGDICSTSVGLNQYYAKEGNNYYFYPSFVLLYGGYWHTVLATDESTTGPGPYDCNNPICSQSISTQNLKITINSTNYNINTYIYKPYILTDNCVTSSSPGNFFQGNLTIT